MSSQLLAGSTLTLAGSFTLIVNHKLAHSAFPSTSKTLPGQTLPVSSYRWDPPCSPVDCEWVVIPSIADQKRKSLTSLPTKSAKYKLQKLDVLEKRRIERRTSSMLKKRYTTKPYPLLDYIIA